MLPRMRQKARIATYRRLFPEDAAGIEGSPSERDSGALRYDMVLSIVHRASATATDGMDLQDAQLLKPGEMQRWLTRS
jgi:hypothetical protein